MGIFSRSESDQSVVAEAGLTLVLGDKHAAAGWWVLEADSIHFKDSSTTHRFVDQKEGLAQVDMALQELPKESEASKQVVFGVEPSWMKDGELINAAKAWLKQISDNLNLEPIGFVVTPEAYAHHVQHNLPQANCVLVYLSANDLQVSVLRSGQQQLIEKVGRSGNVAADVVEALMRHETAESVWPAKVWLYSSSVEVAELQAGLQDFKTYAWNDQTPWSAAPLVDVVDDRELIAAVSIEGGRAAKGLPSPISPTLSAANPVVTHPVNPVTVTAKSFGIPVELPAENSQLTSQAKTFESSASMITVTSPNKKSFFTSMVNRERQFAAHHPFILAGVVLGLISVLLGGWMYLRQVSRVTLVLTPQTTTLSQELPILFSTNASATNSASQLIVPARTIEVEVQVTKNGPTTGVKLVGEKAKGQVTMLNKSTTEKLFNAGTVISANGHEFSLDSDVSVASASVSTSGDSETKTFGKSTVAVTASDIGTDHNLAADTTFTVQSFDQNTFAATNEDALTGGSSRETRAVAEVDRQTILKNAREEAIAQAEVKLREQVADGEYALPSGKLTLTSTEYTADVGDEIEAVGVTITAQVGGVAYQAVDLRNTVAQALRSAVPDGQELIENNIEVLSTPDPTANAGQAVRLLVSATAPVRPRLDPQLLSAQLANKKVADLPTLAGSIVSLKGIELMFEPGLAKFVLQQLPPAEKINITIK